MATNTTPFANEVVGGDIVKQGYLWVKRPPRSYWNKIKVMFSNDLTIENFN